MFNINFKGMIFNVTKYSFSDDTTGEVVKGCKVEYLVPKDETENSKGYLSLSCNVKMTNYDLLKTYVGKFVNMEVEPNLAKAKFKLIKVDSHVLS